jgi:uncharacterized membrane protein
VSSTIFAVKCKNAMGEYFGFFVFLGFFLMAFWILLFLVGFLGYWATMGALNSLMPNMFAEKEEEIAKELDS